MIATTIISSIRVKPFWTCLSIMSNYSEVGRIRAATIAVDDWYGASSMPA
jgi:hypothetical protein